jgi:hypothetical protein
LRDENTPLRTDLSLDEEALQSVIRANINPLPAYPARLFRSHKGNNTRRASLISEDKTSFREFSIGAIQIPWELQGFGTLFNAFFHLAPQDLQRSCETRALGDAPLEAGCKWTHLGTSYPFSGLLASTLFWQTSADSLKVARPHPFANRGAVKRPVYILCGGESVPKANDRRKKP